MLNPSDKLRKTTRKALVKVRLSNGEEYRGYVHLGYCERVQDVLNDERKFIPLVEAPSSGSPDDVVMMGKQYIVSIREVQEQADKVAPSAPAGAKLARLVLGESELKLVI